ncbi:MAG: TlpA disulfide reductase family protein [Rubrivivax sp.]|nr:TlpA disulfide reductase family protein [Rubrivivax sp.]
MLSISLGPIALPVAPLLLLAAVWIASWVATKLSARQGSNPEHPEGADAAGNAVFVAAAIGLLAARLAHLASNAQPYLASPASMLDLRDGGWDAMTGATVATAWLVWRGWRMRRLRRPLALAVVAGMLVWSAGLLFTGARDAASMPMTALATLEGGHPVDLRMAAAGRPVVVNLWASWCGPCRQEMPALAEAQQRERAVGFLFVNQGESESTIRAYLAGLGLPLREVLRDPGSQLGPAVGSRGLPTTLFYDAKGSLVDAHFGVLNPAALETRLRALRANR